MSTLALALPIDFEHSDWLWLCLLVPVLIVASLRSLAGLDPARRVLALVARSALVILLALCLAGVQYVKRSDELTVIFLMDRSHSVEALERFEEEYIHRATADMPKDDRVGVIDFARNAYLEQLPMRGGYFIPPGRLSQIPNSERTDIAAALRLAMAMFPADTAKRMVLMSDGNDNMGDVLTEVRRAGADGIPVDVVPLDYEHANEVYFERLIAPSYAEPGEQLPVRMVLHSYRPVRGRISLYQNGRLVPLTPEQSRLELNQGANTFFMKLSAESAGTQTYEAVFEPDDESMDAVALNNRASAFTFVSGKSTALLVTAGPQADAVLMQALESENVQVDMVRAGDLGQFGLANMMDYATVILSNVPAADFTEDQQQELAIYVRDMGSGLIMLGGDEAFGAGGWIGSPVEEIMPVSFEIKHKRVIPRGALVLIMHSCEIPRGNYWGKEMAKKSVDTISSQDYVGVLAYTYSPGGENWEVPLDLNTNRGAVKAKIDRMQIGDMPDFGRTMQMAYDGLVDGKGRDAAQKHVIILSDGDAQPPPPALLEKFKAAQITVSTVGIGWGAHVQANTLVDVARTTGGTYYDARNPRQLPQIFMKESKVVRRPLIIDEPFQPQVLHAYSELLGGINPRSDRLPALGGMVLTSPKDSPHAIIPIIRATDDGEDPVLAHWQIGLGKSVVFTSGYWPVWGQAWTQWAKFAKFWAQIVRWTMRQETPANFDTYTRIDGNRGRIVIDALDKDAGYLNNLQLRATIIGPDRRPIPGNFTQRGPGNYQADFDVEKSGQYLASIQVYDGEKHIGTIRSGLSVPYSPEYRDLTPNESLLRQTADLSGGRWLDMPAEEAGVFDHNVPPAIARRPVWEWVLAWMILPLFLLDVAVRRLASWLAFSVAVELVIVFVLLFGVGIWDTTWWGVVGTILLGELIGWSIRFRSIRPMLESLTHGVTVLAKAGERSTESLEKLKDTRERVRDELSEKEPERLRRVAAEEEAVSRDMARRRFDVGDRAGSEPARDLVESLDGAKAVPGTEDRRAPARTEDRPEAEEATTARLLRSKRKKREDQR
jgi:uncharacterized membrane protein